MRTAPKVRRIWKTVRIFFFETEPIATIFPVLQVQDTSIRVRAHQSITSVGLNTRRGGHAHGSTAEEASIRIACTSS
jgi:hypothetical protein